MSSLLGLEEEQSSGQKEGYGLEPNREHLETRVKNGASWFYWIAGLSLVNSLIYLSGSDVAFLSGLGFTQLTDSFVDVAIQNGAPSVLKWVAVAFNFALVAMFGFFGYYAGRRSSPVFVIGIVIYLLDGLLLLLLEVFFSAGFHAFALYFIIRGFLACRTLNVLDSASLFQQTPPPPPASTQSV